MRVEDLTYPVHLEEGPEGERGPWESENGRAGLRPEFGRRVLARCDPLPGPPRFLHLQRSHRQSSTITQVSSSGGSLLPPNPRVALGADRCRSPFQVSVVHFRPSSWPTGSDISKTKLLGLPRPHGVSPFQRLVEGQPLPPPGRFLHGAAVFLVFITSAVPQMTIASPSAGSSEAREEHSRNGAQDLWVRLVFTELGDTSGLVANWTQSRHLNFQIRQCVPGAAAGSLRKFLQQMVFLGWMGPGTWDSPASRLKQIWPTTCMK